MKHFSKWLHVLFCVFCQCICVKNPSVIIVGAGPAGIAAAAKLLENSITNITVLEAEDRIGGRINSVKFGNAFVEIGAEYCHGQNKNVVYEMTKDLDLLTHSLPVTADIHKLYYSNGSLLDESVFEDLVKIVLSDLEVNETSGVSLADAFLRTFNSTILQKYRNDKSKTKIALEAVRFVESSVLGMEGAFSWHTVAAKSHYELCEGDQQMVWKRLNYRTIFDILTKRYPDPNKKLPIDDKIILNKKVVQIIWNNTNHVTVKTSDNSTFLADHVIFTPSIGVLKEQQHTLFSPPLPTRKQEAIEAIGFDGVMKIFLHFQDTWWGNKKFHFLWSEEDLCNILKEFPGGPERNGLSWISFIEGLVPVVSNPNVLIAWVTGDLIPEVEQISEDNLKEGCTYLIRRFLGKDYNITAPDKVTRSQWCTNPNFRGTYSYEKKGSSLDISYQLQLAEPLIGNEGKPVVLFAGEATNPIHYSTVHGAIETGRREGEKIISFYV